MFNKYEFIEDLKEAIKQEQEQDENLNLQDFIFQYLDTEVIYYSHCFDICRTLGFTDFTGHEFGEINNISTAAFCALYDLCIEEGIY